MQSSDGQDPRKLTNARQTVGGYNTDDLLRDTSEESDIDFDHYTNENFPAMS